MLKPFIYAVADERYWHIYGKAFLNSARAHGHEADVFCLKLASTADERAHCATERFRLMPALVKKHGPALALDVDAIIRKPFTVGAEYDVGVFIRPSGPEHHTVWVGGEEISVCARALAGIFYCTEQGLGFAEAIAEAMDEPSLRWGDDQAAIWDAYQRLGSMFRVKLFDTRHMNWKPGSDAPIYAAKGRSKAGGAFLKEVEHWRRHVN